MSHSKKGIVFDYRALRLIMGLIAFSLPFVVTLISATSLSSISASYHTDGRDIFVELCPKVVYGRFRQRVVLM